MVTFGLRLGIRHWIKISSKVVMVILEEVMMDAVMAVVVMKVLGRMRWHWLRGYPDLIKHPPEPSNT